MTKENTKDTYIQIRVTAEEKLEIKELAKKNKFDTVAAYVLWLVRNRGNK